MDILGAIAAMNKISLFAFLLTLIFIVYEIRQMRKVTKIAIKEKPIIPSFNPSLTPQIKVESPPKAQLKEQKKTNPHIFIFIILLLLGILFAFLSISSLNNATHSSQTNQVNLQEVQSSGIKVFDTNWQEIKGDTANTLDPGTTIYVGIAMIKGADIDQARIKINESQWSADHITKEFKNDYNVFYKPYIIKEGETKLVIEAQLHSMTNGWLTE